MTRQEMRTYNLLSYLKEADKHLNEAYEKLDIVGVQAVYMDLLKNDVTVLHRFDTIKEFKMAAEKLKLPITQTDDMLEFKLQDVTHRIYLVEEENK